MKSNIFASSIIIFSLLLFSSSPSYARKEPAAGAYWKSIMKDKPMPKALKELFHEDDQRKVDHFVRDFVLKSSAIIYHRTPESKIDEKNKQQPKEKSINPKQQKVPSYTHQEMKDKLYKINNKTP